MGLEQTLKGAAESLLKIGITKMLLIYSNNQIIIKTLKENPLITSGYIEERISILFVLKSWNRLVNKLQNVMFSKKRMNGMYSNSAARARGTRVQSPKREEILRWNTYSSLANFYNFLKACDNVIRVTDIFPNS